jgi:sulfoxide reductase heme-binding subunit YedZ
MEFPMALPRNNTLIEGWPLVGTMTVLVTAIAIVAAGAGNFESDGARAAIRATARTSFVLFCLAYGAAALVRFWPNQTTSWIRRNRRYLGVSFAASHGVHAVAILSLALLAPEEFRLETRLAMLIPGSIGYLFIAAMAATSFDRTAAAIGPRAWRLLHAFGGFYIWVGFLNGFASRAMAHPSYWGFVAVLLAVMALRLATLRRPKVTAIA